MESIKVINSWIIKGRGILVELEHSGKGLSSGIRLKSNETGKVWLVGSRVFFNSANNQIKFSGETESAMNLGLKKGNKSEDSKNEMPNREKEGIFQYFFIPEGEEIKPEVGDMLTFAPAKKASLDLDKVVLLGRNYEEYAAYFGIKNSEFKGKKILDVAGGVSSFCAEANEKGIKVKSLDPVYELSIDEIENRCKEDLKNVIAQMPSVEHVYNWDFYKNISGLEQYREKAYKTFVEDFKKNKDNYIFGSLPKLNFKDKEFDVTLVSYFLFLYSDRFDLDFHIQSILELTRISKEEVRIYPLTTLEGKKSKLVEKCIEKLKKQDLDIEIRKVNFEFFKNANEMLVIRPRLLF